MKATPRSFPRGVNPRPQGLVWPREILLASIHRRDHGSFGDTSDEPLTQCRLAPTEPRADPPRPRSGSRCHRHDLDVIASGTAANILPRIRMDAMPWWSCPARSDSASANLRACMTAFMAHHSRGPVGAHCDADLGQSVCEASAASIGYRSLRSTSGRIFILSDSAESCSRYEFSCAVILLATTGYAMLQSLAAHHPESCTPRRYSRRVRAAPGPDPPDPSQYES
jgi:hypothetical protein